MNFLLISVIIIVTEVFIFYFIGVIGEARHKVLQWKDIARFSLLKIDSQQQIDNA